jgi:hypothetical protein
LIEEAAAAAGAGGVRRRLLPAAAVMVFVLGLCLFSGEGYREVARKLAGWLGPLAGRSAWPVPGSAALARARRRVGPAPFRLLFRWLAGPLAGPQVPGASQFGRLLAALDGTIVDVACTPANLAAFGAPPHGPDGAGGYPQVRLVTVTACGTRGLIDAVFRGRRQRSASEPDLARKIAARGRLGPGMLVLADRNFCGYPVAAAIAATGADLLIRVKSSQWLPVLEALPDGSARSVLAEPASGQRHAAARRRGRPLPGPPAGLPVRVIDATLTLTPASGPPRTERYRLITTLAAADAPAAAVAACYAQRWEVENSYRELKVFTGAGRVLRSRDPAGVTQEIYAFLCTSQLINAARASAAQAGGGLDPDRISYTVTLRAIRRATITPGPAGAISAEALSQPLPPRRRRSYPRLLRTSTAKRRRARTSPASAISYKITINPPPAPDLPGP